MNINRGLGSHSIWSLLPPDPTTNYKITNPNILTNILEILFVFFGIDIDFKKNQESSGIEVSELGARKSFLKKQEK